LLFKFWLYDAGSIQVPVNRDQAGREARLMLFEVETYPEDDLGPDSVLRNVMLS
jgi:hypothetical protein